MIRYWQGNPKMRIAIGLGLLSGGMLATATGAFATAGVILGVRAGVSALGAFTSSKGIYELIRGYRSKSEIENLVLRSKQVRNVAELEPILLEIERRHTADSLAMEVSRYREARRKHRRVANIVGTTAALAAGILGLQKSVDVLVAGT